MGPGIGLGGAEGGLRERDSGWEHTKGRQRKWTGLGKRVEDEGI